MTAAVAWLASRFLSVEPCPLPPGTTFDEAATGWRLFHAADDPPEPMPEDAQAKAAWAWRRARRDDRVFAATSNVYKHYRFEIDRPLDPEGASIRSSFSEYLAFERTELEREFGVHAAAVATNAPSLQLGSDVEVTRVLGHASRWSADAIGRAHPNPGTGTSKPVWLLDAGDATAIDARRDAALERVTTTHVGAARIVHVPYSASNAALPPLGRRLTAAAVIGDQLVKDVVMDDQWTELLLGRASVPAAATADSDHPMFDAHIHLADDDDDALVAAIASGGVQRAVVAPLPQGVDYSELDAANERVLRAAKRFPERIVPLVMVSPLADDPAADLERLVERGARGLKLISGHDAYFKAARLLPLDDAKMMSVFEVCRRHALPVLWHVNSHLYGEGFLRVLRAFPTVRFVNPHYGGYLTYAPSSVRALLEAYPNLSFDVSLGARAIYVRRSLEDLGALAPAWRKLFVDYSGRFLWGTDMVLTKDTSRAHTNATYRLYRDTFERERYDLDYVPARGFSRLWEDSHHRQGLVGLALPQDVLRKLYWSNAEAIYWTHLR